MRTHIRAILAIGLFLVLGTAVAADEQASTEYRVGPKDLLEVTAMGVPEITKLVVRVSEDGRVTLPLVGEVDVNNLTQHEVEKKLIMVLGEKYIINPQVSVFILEYKSKRVSVLGAVEKPGPYELLGRQTIMSIISQAGGMTRDAGNEIIVIRQSADGSGTSIRISVDDLFVKGEARLNIPLEPNDIITIPVDKVVLIYVFGQVKNPGALQVKRSSIPTLLQAIAQAGGFSDRAARSGIKIRRKDAAGRDIELDVNVKNILKGKTKDIPLKENDTVYVPESLF
ncbi:MAG: polysaccharide biosynthesis/export family protein [Candidatus Aminicenantales bacterium]|jgi:polysaccharide export outer membrane protein